jgi:hypothetical protein
MSLKICFVLAKTLMKQCGTYVYTKGGTYVYTKGATYVCTKGGTYMYTKETGFKQSFSSDMKLSA